MLKRIQSAISTAHAIGLAIREAPDAIRECVEFARKNSNSLNELEATRKALESVDATCCKWRVKCDALARELDAAHNERDEFKRKLAEFVEKYSPGITLQIGEPGNLTLERRISLLTDSSESMSKTCKGAIDRNFELRAEVDALKSKLTETERALAEMNGMYDEQCKATIAARENIEGLYSEVAKERDELKARIENQASEIAALRNKVTGLVDERDELKRLSENQSALLTERLGQINSIEAERDFLARKLDRHEEAAERWHQVTAGEGELPPPIPVLWEPNSKDYHEQFRFIRSGLPDGWTTYRWRYISSQDVPCQP